MKNHLVFAACAVSSLLILLLPGRVAAEETPAPAGLKDELVRLEKQSWEAWQNHDAKFFDRFLSEDHVEIEFGGVTNKAGVLGTIQAARCAVKGYTLRDFELHMLNPDLAVLTFWASQETTCGKFTVPSPCWTSSIYMKREGRWMNVFFQQTQSVSPARPEA